MKKILIITLFFLTFKLQIAASSPYETLDSNSSYVVNKASVIEITPVTPIKSQDGIGICYGFSATSLLENFRCRELNLDCSSPSEFISTIDVTSFLNADKKGLQELGTSISILENVQKSNHKIAREECAQFSTLVHQKKIFFANEKDGWDLLVKTWNEYKGIGVPTNDCVSCLVDKLKKSLSKIKTPDDQLRDAFKASSLNEFIYKSILPLECLDENKVANIPPFVAHSFPKNNNESSESALKNKIENLLKSKIPVEIGICLDGSTGGGCSSAHSVALFGIKQACSGSDCKTLVKIKNSLGKGWQNQNNDGWVELEPLVKSSLKYRSDNNISWIEKP